MRLPNPRNRTARLGQARFAPCELGEFPQLPVSVCTFVRAGLRRPRHICSGSGNWQERENPCGFNTNFGSTTGYFDDAAFSTIPEPGALGVLVGGLLLLRRRRTNIASLSIR
jgi:MYXO-CTERM domain-containing protein